MQNGSRGILLLGDRCCAGFTHPDLYWFFNYSMPRIFYLSHSCKDSFESLCMPRNVNLIYRFQISQQVLQLDFSAPRSNPGRRVCMPGCSVTPRTRVKRVFSVFSHLPLDLLFCMQMAHSWILLRLKMDLAKTDSGSKNKVGNKIISTFFAVLD